MPLTDIVCRKTRPQSRLKKLSDGGGLQLWVQPNGTKLWRLAYRFGGKQKGLALGAYQQRGVVGSARQRITVREPHQLFRIAESPSKV